MSFRKAAILAATFWIALAGAAFAQQRAPYTALNPPQPAESDKVEVLEFFWYGCPHCYSIESSVAAWQKSLPKDVVFKRVPAAQGGWSSLASVFLTIEAMGLLDQYHGKIFDAIHKQNVNLGNEKIRDEWLAKNGVDVAKYKEMEKSFAVMTRLQRAKQMSASYKIDAVPQFIVNGKYVITAESAGGQEQMLKAVDVAVANSRREMAAAAPAAPAGTAKR
jgi:protein dithiol oxidoreductase (disulfide-forming)